MACAKAWSSRRRRAVRPRPAQSSTRLPAAARPTAAETSSVSPEGKRRTVRISLPVALPHGGRGTLTVGRSIPNAARLFRDQLIQQLALVGVLVVAMGAIAVV